MRIRVLEVKRFGALRDRHFKLDRKAVVIYGPNEAGKSSFHAAVETALYGFSPASRETHPYARWDEEGDLEVLAEFEPRAGGRIVVERTLRATPGTRLAPTRGELTGSRRGNTALPGLESLPRTLFRAVYSLTANDTTFQRDEVREHIRELLLGERGLENARPIREVRSKLQKDHSALWKPTERGKPVAKELRAEIRVAQKDEREARKRERSLHEEAIEQADLLAEREELASRRVTLRKEDAEASFLEEIAELRVRMDAVQPLSLDALAGSPMEDPTPIHEELALLRVELEGPRERLIKEAPHLALFDRMLLARIEEVEGVLREAGVDASDRERRNSTLGRVEGATHSARQRLERSGTRMADLERCRSLDLEPLEAGLSTWQADILATGGRVESPLSTRLLLGAALVFLVVAATSIGPPWIALGSLLALPVVMRRDRRSGETPPPASLLTALAGLEMPPMESPLALRRAIADLNDARSLLAEAQREREEAAGLGAKIAAREARWLQLATSLSESGEDLASLPVRLEKALAGAQKNESARRAGHEQRERDEQHITTHTGRERRLAKKFATLKEALRANFPDLEAESAFTAWKEAERELEYIRRRERELRGDSRWGELALDARLDLEGDIRPWSESARRTRAEELARLDERLEQLRERRGEIGAHLDGDMGSAVAEAAERVQLLQEELGGVLVSRDRLALLERILIVAERDYRAAHQPDVLQRAGEYLSLITDGRYTGLCYPHGQEGPLCVQPAEREEPVPVDAPLSRGTREQVYLCLRLGTLDDLDRDREGLPLVLDEALVHWDEGRRSALYPLLEQVSKRRQVILFTCHPEQAEEASQALSAEVIDLHAGALQDG